MRPWELGGEMARLVWCFSCSRGGFGGSGLGESECLIEGVFPFPGWRANVLTTRVVSSRAASKWGSLVFPGGAPIRIIDRSFPRSFVSCYIDLLQFRLSNSFSRQLSLVLPTRNVYPRQAPPLQTSVFARLPTRSRPSYLHTPRAKEARRPR